MSIRYDENAKARAVRLVRERRDDYDSEWAAVKAIAGRLGMSTETLRKWVRQAEVDAGDASGVSSEGRRELRELRRKTRELEQTIEILKAATANSTRQRNTIDHFSGGVRGEDWAGTAVAEATTGMGDVESREVDQ